MLTKLVVFLFGIVHAASVMCNGAAPLQINGKQAFCGRGPGSITCPSGFKCEIDSRDAYAVCCFVVATSSSSTTSSSSSGKGQSSTRTTGTQPPTFNAISIAAQQKYETKPASVVSSSSASNYSSTTSTTASGSSSASARPNAPTSLPPTPVSKQAYFYSSSSSAPSSLPTIAVIAQQATEITSVTTFEQQSGESYEDEEEAATPSPTTSAPTTYAPTALAPSASRARGGAAVSVAAASAPISSAPSRARGAAAASTGTTTITTTSASTASSSTVSSTNAAMGVPPATMALVVEAISKSICPPGIPRVNCYMDSCTVAKCPGVKDAKCVSYPCGGCNALWYGPAGLIPESQCRPTAESASKCPVGMPLKNYQGGELFCGRGPSRVECPPGTSCEIDPSDRFAVCCAGGSSCPRGLSPANCVIDPCVATSCPGVQGAKCVSNNCGGCNALWYSADGGLLTALQCRPPAQAASCPPGVPTFQCYVDPCSVTKCPGVKDAKCTADYCGWCNAAWKDAAGTMLSARQCSAPLVDAKCSNGDLTLINSQGAELFCGRGPNSVQCPPGSLCNVDPLDRFAVCCSSSTCPPGVPIVNCFVNPCQFAKCPGVKDAKCVANYCGGCNALWFAPNGGLLTDSQCRAGAVTPCPEGVSAVQCYVDPCMASDCPSVKDAKCVANYCGGCNAVWSANGSALSYAQCHVDNKCPAGGMAVRNSQGADLFCGRGPSRVDCPSSSTCVVDPADRFAVCCQGPRCPTGAPVASCYINPCSIASCPRVRDARCVANYCGGCNALWYHPNGGLLSDRECRTDVVTCPADKPAVLCYSDPCLFASCPGVQGARCIASYCGGCSAQWYGPTGNLLTSKQCELIPGPVRYLHVRTLAAETEAMATWVRPNGTFCGLSYTAELSYDGQAWTPLSLEEPFSMFCKFTVTPRKKFQVRVAAERGPAVQETFTPKKVKK